MSELELKLPAEGQLILNDLMINRAGTEASITAIALVETIVAFSNKPFTPHLYAAMATALDNDIRGQTLEEAYVHLADGRTSDLLALLLAVHTGLLESEDIGEAVQEETRLDNEEIVRYLCENLDGFDAFYNYFASREKEMESAIRAKIEVLTDTYVLKRPDDKDVIPEIPLSGRLLH